MPNIDELRELIDHALEDFPNFEDMAGQVANIPDPFPIGPMGADAYLLANPARYPAFIAGQIAIGENNQFDPFLKAPFEVLSNVDLFLQSAPTDEIYCSRLKKVVSDIAVSNFMAEFGGDAGAFTAGGKMRQISASYVDEAARVLAESNNNLKLGRNIGFNVLQNVGNDHVIPGTVGRNRKMVPKELRNNIFDIGTRARNRVINDYFKQLPPGPGVLEAVNDRGKLGRGLGRINSPLNGNLRPGIGNRGFGNFRGGDISLAMNGNHRAYIRICKFLLRWDLRRRIRLYIPRKLLIVLSIINLVVLYYNACRFAYKFGRHASFRKRCANGAHILCKKIANIPKGIYNKVRDNRIIRRRIVNSIF